MVTAAATQSIRIAGTTGSGKTTLANALLAEITDLDERVVIIENTPQSRSWERSDKWQLTQ
jgi:Flp pilus assembly CpaF family ATPase